MWSTVWKKEERKIAISGDQKRDRPDDAKSDFGLTSRFGRYLCSRQWWIAICAYPKPAASRETAKRCAYLGFKNRRFCDIWLWDSETTAQYHSKETPTLRCHLGLDDDHKCNPRYASKDMAICPTNWPQQTYRSGKTQPHPKPVLNSVFCEQNTLRCAQRTSYCIIISLYLRRSGCLTWKKNVQRASKLWWASALVWRLEG